MKYDSATLETVFNIVPVSIMILDENALIRYVNRAASSLINKNQEEVLCRSFGDSIDCIGRYDNEGIYGHGPICDNCAIKSAITSALINGQSTDNIEINKYLLRKGKKEEVWFKMSITPITVDKKINVLITIIDISDLKTAKESLNRYLMLAEITDNIILFVDLEGNILDVNKAAIKSYGYSYEELCSMNVHDIRADQANIIEQMETADKTGIFFEAIHKRKDGTYLNVEVSSRAIFMNGKRVLGSIIRDITERKAIEEKLHESEEHNKALISNLPGIAYRCKYDRKWTMEFISDGCHKLTGYKAESLLNNKEISYMDIINEEYREYLWMKWAEILKNRDNLKEEYSITTSSGEIKWVFEQGHGMYDENGQVIALEGLIIDITDRKRKENEILYLNYHDVLTGLYN